MSKHLPLAVALIAVLILTATGCGPTVAPPTAAPPQVPSAIAPPATPQVITKVETQVVTTVVTPTPEPPKAQGTMTIGLATSINTLDPFNYPEIDTFNVVHHICETLIYQADDGTPTPGLAVSWENLNDTTWRLKLRQGVTFHDGEPFNADAVVFSWKYSQDPKALQKFGYASIQNIEIEDPYTIKITTKGPDPLLVSRLSGMGFVVPPKYIQDNGRDYFAEHPVGTGPFKLLEWVKGDHVTLEANPNYWMPGVPKIEKLVFMSIPEVSSRVAALKAGQIDLAYRVESQYAPDLLYDPKIKVLRFSVPRVYYFGFNTVNLGKGTAIENEQVRQALAYGLDVQAIIDKVLQGNAVRDTTLVGNKDFGFDSSLAPIPYDPAKAKALLAEAGYPNGFTIDMGAPAGAYASGKEVCEAAVGYWAKIGVKANLSMIESGKYWDDAIARKYPPIFYDSWSTNIGDAQERLEGFLLKDGSYSNYYDTDVEALVKDTGTTINPDQRKAKLSDLQKMMLQKMPGIALYEPYGFQAISDRVVGYVARGPETIFLWNTSLRQ